MIVLPHQAPPARRWLAHFVNSSETVEAPPGPLENAPEFDPAAVLALAMHERVAAVIHLGCVRGRIVDPLPNSFRGACEASYYRTLQRNKKSLETGKRVLDALRADGISAAATDGWALLAGPFRYYEDVGARPLENLELMLRESDKDRAESLLADIGLHRIAIPQGDRELTLRHNDADTDLFVDLRWGWQGSVGPNAPVSVTGDEFLNHLCDTTVSGYHRSGRITNLVVASIRAATHTLGRWIWLDDIHRIVTALPMNWDELVATARRWRVRAPVYASLMATRELLGTPIPHEVLRRLAPGPVRRRLLHHSLAACQGKGSSSGAARAARLLLSENWWEVARAAARNAAPSQGWSRPSPALVRLGRSVQLNSPAVENV